jgi:ParB/RepB/Spo0J family partition protein
MATATIPRGTKTAAQPPDGLEPIAIDPNFGVVAAVTIDLVDVGPNVRVNIAELEELTASIVEHGVLQPIKVRPAGGRFVVVWGQRRLLAAKAAGLARIPAIVETPMKRKAHELAVEQLVENLHRADLNPIDRARAMRSVVDAGVSQADLARELGLGASTIANDLRLLDASPGVHKALETGAITASHAKAMLPLPAKDQDYFIERVRSGGLSAHRLEEEVGWKLQTLRGEELAKQRAEKQAPKLVTALEAAGVAKETRVYLQTPYNMRGEAIEAAVKKAGWKLGDRGSWARERGPESKCDCQAVRVEFNRSWKVAPACVEDRHRDRQVSSDHVAEEKRRKAIQAKVQKLKVAIAAVLASGIPVPLVKLVAARNLHDLPELWASDAADEIGGIAARNLAAVASSEYAYGGRDKADALLDEVLTTFDALATELAAPA